MIYPYVVHVFTQFEEATGRTGLPVKLLKLHSLMKIMLFEGRGKYIK
jgi:hypothetical protein